MPEVFAGHGDAKASDNTRFVTWPNQSAEVERRRRDDVYDADPVNSIRRLRVSRDDGVLLRNVGSFSSPAVRLPMDITQQLLPDTSKIDELEVFLATRGDSSEIGETACYEGGRLRVNYTKRRGRVESIVWDGDSFPRQLVDRASEALFQSSVVVARRYLHAWMPVEGFYRYQSELQVLPAPADAPRPEWSYAQHPFLVEFSHATSPNEHVDQHRQHRRFAEVSLTLNALLKAIVLPHASTSHEWTVTGPPRWSSEYRQLGYVGGLQPPATTSDGFSDVDDLAPIESVPDTEYYGEIGVSDRPVAVPEGLGELIQTITQLDDKHLSKLRRSSHWKHVADRVFTFSASASYAATAAAVEALMPSPARCDACNLVLAAQEPCPECGQSSSGVTEQFRRFVDCYAPGIDKSERAALYHLRSSITHGDRLLAREGEPYGFRHNPAERRERARQMAFAHILQVIIVNWLHGQSDTGR